MSKKTRRPYRSQQPRPQAMQLEVMEQKVNPAYSGIVMYSDNPQPHSMPKNYKSYASEGYRGNDTLFKVIGYILTNGAAIPPVLYTDATCTKKIKKHPLLDKLARPNIEQSGVAYRKAVIGYFLVAGNSYQYAIRKGTIGPPDELWTLQPDKVKINPTKTRGVVSYMYDDFDGTFDNPVAGQNPIPAANMAHLKSWSPDDPLFGVSPIEVGAIKVDQQSAAQKWNLGLLQNGGKLSGAFTTPIILAPNDRKKTEDRLNDKIAGPKNAGRFAVLDGGLTWNQMGMPPAQMDWLPGIQYNSNALANLYNIPPELTGDTSASTYNNIEQAKAASYTEEIFPVLDDLYALWNMWLVPMYPDLCDASGTPTAYLYYDKETVEVVQNVIQQQKTARATRANQSWMQGDITMNEARDIQGLPPDPNGDVYRFGSVLVRREDLGKYAEQSLQKPAAPPMPVPEPELNLPSPPSGGENDPPAPKPVPGTHSNADARHSADSSAGKSSGKAALPASLRPPASPLATPTGQKALDTHGVYQPDDLEARLADYSAQGVTHVRWMCDGNPCPDCAQNDTVMVELGDPFPSGHIQPPAHPNCKCSIVTFSLGEWGKDAKPHDRKQARDDYRQFIEEVVLA